MNTTTTGCSPLASLALRIGETVTIRTADGFDALVRIIDVRMSYGAIQVAVTQPGQSLPGLTGPASNVHWIDAAAKGLIR